MRRKRYTNEVCTSEFLLRQAYTVKTLGGVTYFNMWNGEYISGNGIKISVSALHRIARSVSKDGKVIAARNRKEHKLRFLEEPIKIKKYY